MIDITMPRLSDTMEEGAIASWRKHPGDRVEVGDILAEIETDKATMEYEAYEAGTLSEILVNEGETVAIGTPIARLDDGESASAPVATSEDVTPSASAVGDLTETVIARAPSVVSVAAASPGDRRIASPLVRKLAREHRLDLSTVTGTGPGGRIIRTDIDALLSVAHESIEASPAASAPTASPAPADLSTVDPRRGSEVVEVTRARRVIARRLGESARTIPHFYVTGVADAEVMVQMRADLNDQLTALGQPKVSVNDLLVRACALALREHPSMNASYIDDASPTMLVHHRVNIGVAVASPNGLVVPVIVDADRKTVNELGHEARELAGLANAKGLTIEQMSGGTFTISNLGMYGVEQFTAIINPPEGAILAVGATIREPVVVGEQIVPRHRIRFTLSADHRIIDGALAAQYLATLTRLIENPWRIIS